MTPPDQTAGVGEPDLSGRTLGEFHLLRKLGQGGMGQVYLARQQTLKREVAVKILRPELARNTTALRRFQAEAEAVARVTHANIVQVHAIGEQDGLHYMALEYVDGRTLRDYLAKKGAPDLPVALSIMRQVAAGLARAHEAGFVHRDVKPENILVTRKVEVKVTDFGLSRCFAADEQPLHLTQSGVAMGTPLYMSPEQVQGKKTDPRTDLYSFGITCYHLLAGEPPYRGATAFEVAIQHVQGEPVPLERIRPDLPVELCRLVHRLMEKRPEDRPATAREMLRDLARIRDGLTGAAPAPSAPIPVAEPVTRPPSRRRLAGVALVASLAVAGWLLPAALSPDSPVEESPASPERGPTKLPSAREKELLEDLRSAKLDPARYTQVSVELALLYVTERRLDEADGVFRRLRIGPFNRLRVPDIGAAIVLAYRDDADPDAPAKSCAKLIEALHEREAKAALPALRGMPQLARGIAEAVRRNGENLRAQGKALDPRLERLKSPSGVLVGGKP